MCGLLPFGSFRKHCASQRRSGEGFCYASRLRRGHEHAHRPGQVDSEARGRRHPGRGRRPREGLLRSLGWRLDADFAFDTGFRIVQLTPPGSPCSIQFGTNLTPAGARARPRASTWSSPTSRPRARRARRPGRRRQRGLPRGRAPGGRFDPAARGRSRPTTDQTYGSFATFSDPDGNSWLLQEITTRLPGRVDAAETAYASVPRPRRARCGARRPPTASTSSAPARPTRTGPTGTPRTWSPEQAGTELPQ